MIQVFLASLLLSVIHASIPNHWLPLIAIGKSEKWSHSETMFGTVVTGFAHDAFGFFRNERHEKFTFTLFRRT